MVELIDMHCHLDLYPQPLKVADEAARRNVYVLSVTTTPSAFKGTLALARASGRIKTAIGLHPELAVSREKELPLFEHLLPQTRYVGEVGIDGSREHRASLPRQASIFMEILFMCARAGGKIISIHSRDARAYMLDVLSMEPLAGQAILHWFVGSAREIDRAVDLECWFSVSPAMLKSKRGREAAMKMPRDRVLPETDGPFGMVGEQTSYPWEAMDIAHQLSEFWNEPVEQTRRQLVENFRRLSVS